MEQTDTKYKKDEKGLDDPLVCKKMLEERGDLPRIKGRGKRDVRAK